MKKILTLLTLLTTIIFISCNNETTAPRYVEEDITIEPDGKKVYGLISANIRLDGTVKYFWEVKEGDVETLNKIWGYTITNYLNGLTVAYGPTYSGNNHEDLKGRRRAYFGYELNKTGNEAFDIYDKDKTTIINKFKGVRIVRLPGKTPVKPDGSNWDGLLTVAGVYSNTGKTSEFPQYVNQDMTIAFRQDINFTLGDIEKDGSAFYAMQFMFDKKQKTIDTADKNFEPYMYSETSMVNYYNEHEETPNWNFALKKNYK